MKLTSREKFELRFASLTEKMEALLVEMGDKIENLEGELEEAREINKELQERVDTLDQEALEAWQAAEAA